MPQKCCITYIKLEELYDFLNLFSDFSGDFFANFEAKRMRNDSNIEKLIL
jgi:hypothetical protein